MKPSVELNIKKLRVFTQLASRGNVNAAADALFLTQSAVSRSLKSLEEDIGCPLFIRSSRGMVLTDVGAILQRRTARAFAYLGHSEEEIRRLPSAQGVARARSGYAGRLAQRHITIVPQIGDHRSETSAARTLGISQPAVNAALRDLEQSMDEALFARTSRGMVPTLAGDIVIRAFKLYASEVRHIESDLAQREGETRGSLVVGCLPLSGAGMLAAVAGRFSQQYPDIRLAVVEAQYDALLNGLICGEIDLIVGTLLPTPNPQVLQRAMLGDHLVAVVRAGHPLTQQTGLAVGALEKAQWIVPFRRTSTHNTFEKAMLKAGLSTPHGAIETNSVATARAVLLQSDRVSILPRSQVAFDVASGSLSILPVDLSGAELTLGVATRSDAEPTMGQLSFVEMLAQAHGASTENRAQ